MKFDIAEAVVVLPVCASTVNIKAFLEENPKYADIKVELVKDIAAWTTACQLKKAKAERKKNMADILAFAELLEENTYNEGDDEENSDAWSHFRSREVIELFGDIMDTFKNKRIMLKIKSLIAHCEATEATDATEANDV